MSESWQAYYMRLETEAFGKVFQPDSLPKIGSRRGPVWDGFVFQQPAALRTVPVNRDLPEYPPVEALTPLVMNRPKHLGGKLVPAPLQRVVRSRDEEIALWNQRNATFVDRPLRDTAHHCTWACAVARTHLLGENEL